MFSKNNKVLSSEEFDLKPYLEGADIYNSKIFYMIPKLPSIAIYRVDMNEYRIDLISLDIFGTDSLAEVLLIYNGMTIDQLKSGVELKVPRIDDLRNLFRNINSISNPTEYLKKLTEG